jgi:exopolysaccharide biosynthesis protein
MSLYNGAYQPSDKIIALGLASSLSLLSCASSGGTLVMPNDERKLSKKSNAPAQPIPAPVSVPAPTQSQAYEQHRLGEGKGMLSVLVFDPRRVELKVAVAAGGSTAQDIAKKPENRGAVAITNGPYFDGPRPHLYLKSTGKVVNSKIKTSDRFFPENIEAIFIINNKGVALVIPALDGSTSGAVNSPTARLAIQNGPWLVQNGIDVSGQLLEKYPKSPHISKARPRTLLGITRDGKVILATIAEGTGVNLQEAAAEMMKRYKIKELVNMDGGPMTQMVVDLGGKRRADIAGSNQVPAFLVVLPK